MKSNCDVERKNVAQAMPTAAKANETSSAAGTSSTAHGVTTSPIAPITPRKDSA